MNKTQHCVLTESLNCVQKLCLVSAGVMKGGIMKSQNNNIILREEDRIRDELEDLRSRVMNLHNLLPCLKQCSHLSNLLQKVYEIREGLNQLEQGLLHTHLKCCISPSLKVPGEVVIAVSELSTKRHGAIIVIEQEDSLDPK